MDRVWREKWLRLDVEIDLESPDDGKDSSKMIGSDDKQDERFKDDETLMSIGVKCILPFNNIKDPPSTFYIDLFRIQWLDGIY